DGTRAASGREAVFAPTNPLALLAKYSLSITKNVTDAAGRGLSGGASLPLTVRDGTWSSTLDTPGGWFVHEILPLGDGRFRILLLRGLGGACYDLAMSLYDPAGVGTFGSNVQLATAIRSWAVDCDGEGNAVVVYTRDDVTGVKLGAHASHGQSPDVWTVLEQD